MKHTDLILAAREGAYHLLFLLYGASLVALRPTLRGYYEWERLLAEGDEWAPRLRRLEAKGLIEAAEARGEQVLRLTRSGQAAFDGGRDPEAAWNRDWDGNWHLLTFDLPREASQARVKFWRWLRARRFGRLQGSVWITADPVSDLAAVAQEAGLDPGLVVVFTGRIENEQPGQVVAKAWDFPGLDRAYREYLEFSKRILAMLRRHQQPLPMAELAPILSEDRRLWWAAVRSDPFLPKAILPPDYSGIDAWEIRRELHTALATQLAQPT